jgi:hypothetical protein
VYPFDSKLNLYSVLYFVCAQAPDATTRVTVTSRTAPKVPKLLLLFKSPEFQPATDACCCNLLAGQERVARHKLLDSTTADVIAQFRLEVPTGDNSQRSD